MLKIFLCLAALVALAPPALPCSDPAFRKLDFWVGEWDVTTPEGKPAGKSRVEKGFRGCVIIEHWTGADGGEGMSLNNFDPATGKWTQRWVDDGGTVAQLTGTFDGKNLVYRREFMRGGVQVVSRMTFFDLGPEGVRQLVERSTDQGKTWKTGFDGRYRRSSPLRLRNSEGVMPNAVRNAAVK